MSDSRLRLAAALTWIALWGPFFVMWVIFIRSYSRVSLSMALLLAVTAIGSAALLSVPVTRIIRRLRWPGTLRLPFYAAHLFLAAAYATTWLLAIYSFDAIRSGTSPLALMSRSRVIGWQGLMGVWLYGLIAGLAYARHAFERAAEAELRASNASAAAAEARLDALRARLQPHFLFNALHTLHALVREDPAAAERGLERLGDLLRYALKHDARALVPLREEWRFTAEYLEFERLRYGERLVVATAIAADVESWPVPPFALQTLVENAVRHAISVTAGGRIALRARRVDNMLELCVDDSGRSAAPGPTLNTPASGLETLRRRLAALYGDASDLRTEHSRPGWQVTLRIPRPDQRD